MKQQKTVLLDKKHYDLFIALANIAPDAPGDLKALCTHKYMCDVDSLSSDHNTFKIMNFKGDKTALLQDLNFLHYHYSIDKKGDILINISGHGDQSYDWRSKWKAEHPGTAPVSFTPITAILDVDIFSKQRYYRFDGYGPQEDKTVFYSTKDSKGQSGVFLVDFLLEPININNNHVPCGLRFMRCRCNAEYLKELVEHNKECHPVQEIDVINFYKTKQKENMITGEVGINMNSIPQDALPYLSNYLKRTKAHIERVRLNCKRIADANLPEVKDDCDCGLCSFCNGLITTKDEIIKMGQDHDASKFQEPEFVPYIYMNEFYRCKQNGKDFTYPKGIKDRVDEAWLHHCKNNRHHVEFHDKLSDMTPLDLAEMVADWAAMSQELNNSLIKWKNNFIEKHAGFSEEQLSLIDKLVNLFTEVL